MGINLVAATVIAGMFALINYKLKMLQNQRVAAPAGDFDDEDGGYLRWKRNYLKKH